MISPQTQSLLYDFDRSKARSPGTVEFPVRADPFNIVTKLCVLNVQSPYNAILGRPWFHMMRAVSSTHHQLLKYPTPSEMVHQGDQAMTRMVAAVGRKKSGSAQKTSRAGHNEDSPIGEKQKRITFGESQDLESSIDQKTPTIRSRRSPRHLG